MHTTLEGNPSQLECESLVFEFLIQLILRCAENPPNLQELQEPAIVKQIREYLEDNYAENVSLTQLAQIVERTPAHLVRVFSAEVGLPPHAYQIQVRIARAKTLLMRGGAVKVSLCCWYTVIPKLGMLGAKLCPHWHNTIP